MGRGRLEYMSVLNGRESVFLEIDCLGVEEYILTNRQGQPLRIQGYPCYVDSKGRE